MILALAALTLLALQNPPATARVRVVRGPNNQPVAGATVRSCAASEPVGMYWSDPNLPRLEPALARTTPAGRTDENGEIVLPIGGECMVVEACAGEYWGVLSLITQGRQATPPGVIDELCLRPDFDLEVRVLDARDRPLAGIPIASRTEQGAFRRDWIAWRTDERGVARIQHAGYWMHEFTGTPERRELVAIEYCLQPPVEALVDLARPPREPIVLRMPPTGEIELVFEEADGAPIPILGGCALAVPQLREAPPWLSAFPFCGLANLADMDDVRVPGTSTFVWRNVGLDADWDVWVQRNPFSKAVRARVRGPRAQGERVRAIVHPPEVAQLRGQFVDETGAACARVEFWAQVRWMPPPGGWAGPIPSEGVRSMMFTGDHFRVPTSIEFDLGASFICGSARGVASDEQGRFRIDFDSPQDRVGELFLTFVEKRGEPDERSAFVNWKKPPGPGPLDLGQLRLSPSPVIATGVVRDAEGKPLAGVFVEGSSRPGSGFRFGTKTLSDGTFCLRGRCFEEYADLRFRHSDFVESNELGVIRMGTRDLAIVMRRQDPEPK